MTRPKYNPQPDANQPQVIADLTSLGFFVQDVSKLAPLGFDILVWGWHGVLNRPMLLAVEIKTPGGTMTKRETEVQGMALSEFGPQAPYLVAQCAEDILDWFTRIG